MTLAPASTAVFDIADPLPRGRVTLEASAGTGKTYTIVGLATRYLAEGRCTAAELLVVTFARSASRELRQRLLERLTSGLGVLDRALEGIAPGHDEVDRALCDVADPAQLAARRDRLAQALADIDLATISTIHAFCADTLSRVGEVGLGRLLDDEAAFAVELAGDLYLKAIAEDPGAARQLPYFDFAAPELSRAGLVTDPADVVPAPSLTSWDGARAWIAAQTGIQGRRRRHRMGVHTHDDLLHRLAERLTDPREGPAVAARVRDRHLVGLVDEFQDTDPVQWAIVQALFPDATGDDGRALVLVGDPKQAIYGFRGADVNAYVAVRGPLAHYTLPTNFRSDGPLVQATSALFTGQPLGTGITVPPVGAAHPTRLVGLDRAPVTFRVVPDDARVRRTADGGMQITSLRDHVAADVARQTAEILGAGARIHDGGAGMGGAAGGTDGGDRRDAGDGDGRPVGPHDIAVLVRTRRQATAVQRHLTDVAIPSVVNGVGTVMASSAARDWCHLLRALDQPSQAGLARLAAMSDLIGWSAAQVATVDERTWDELHVQLHRWREVLQREGVAAAFRHVAVDTRIAQRLLAAPDGDRRLTDLTHIAELLHVHAHTELTGTAGLLAVVEAGMAQAADSSAPNPPDHLATRLERDGDAVQIMTVHGAKGLEFGIVLAPFLWDGVGRSPVAMRVHDHRDGRRRLYVGSDKRSSEHQRYTDLYSQQSGEEERRLAYVAATRAAHHLRIWWAPAPRSADSPLGTMLARSGRVHSSAQAITSIDQLVAAHAGLFDRTATDEPVGPGWPAGTRGPVVQPPAAAELRLAPFARTIDPGWKRNSYSRLVGGAHAAVDVSAGRAGDVDTPAPGDAGQDGSGDGPGTEEPVGVEVPVVPPDPELAAPVRLGAMRGGADIGTTIHSVLEHVDFASPDLTGRLRHQVQVQSRAHAVDLGDDDAQQVVADGLAAAVRTPLGTDGAPCLADVPRAARLDEMAFEFPVLDQVRMGEAGRVLLTDIADLVQAHLPADDLLAAYPDVLRQELPEVEVRGFLAGFIDLIARLPDGDGVPGGYLVADYKTNRMAPAGVDDVTVGHFTAQAMAAEMRSHHYPLQALIYQVALHRYLRWRLTGYDPERDLAGVAYLFVRGMVGPETPVRDGMRCGVFRWRPPVALIEALDQLFAAGIDPAARTSATTGGDRA